MNSTPPRATTAWRSDVQSLLDRLDPTPAPTCDVVGCIHHDHRAATWVGATLRAAA